VTGATQASDFPHTSGMPFGNLSQNPPSTGAIVASISAAAEAKSSELTNGNF
jgi:hypothetical protein